MIGDRVNTASRVQAAADPGAVFVDDVTRQVTSASIAYEDAGEHTVKGKAEPCACTGLSGWSRASRGAADLRPQRSLRRPRRGAAPAQGPLPRDRRPGRRATGRRLRAGGWARRASASSSPTTSTGSPGKSGGTRAAACPSARASRTGRSPRWSASGSPRRRRPRSIDEARRRARAVDRRPRRAPARGRGARSAHRHRGPRARAR